MVGLYRYDETEFFKIKLVLDKKQKSAYSLINRNDIWLKRQ